MDVVTIVRLSKRRHSVSEGMELGIYSFIREDSNTFYFMNMSDTENKTT